MNPLLLLGIGSALSNTASGIFNYKQRKDQYEDQVARSEAAMEAQRKAAEEAAKNVQQYGPGEYASKAVQLFQEDRAADVAREAAKRDFGASLSALQTGGAKALLGGVGDLSRGLNRRIDEIEAKSQDRKYKGLLDYSAAERDADTRNVGLANQMALFDKGRALELEQQARLAREQGIGGLAGIGSALGSDIFQGLSEVGMTAASSLAEEGAKIKETPGEFSHKTNPIDLVRNGKKIGEATGGELIFNPEQSGKLEQLASDGNTELHTYLRGLFKKFNTNK